MRHGAVSTHVAGACRGAPTVQQTRRPPSRHAPWARGVPPPHGSTSRRRLASAMARDGGTSTCRESESRGMGGGLLPGCAATEQRQALHAASRGERQCERGSR